MFFQELDCKYLCSVTPGSEKFIFFKYETTAFKAINNYKSFWE